MDSELMSENVPGTDVWVVKVKKANPLGHHARIFSGTERECEIFISAYDLGLSIQACRK